MKKILLLFLLVLSCFAIITGCQNTTPENPDETKEIKITYNTYGRLGDGEYQIIDGKLYCRNENNLGLLGDDIFAYYEEWTETSIDADNIIHLEVFSGAMIYLTSEGKVFGLGNAESGKFGIKPDEKGQYSKFITSPVLLFEDCKLASLGTCSVLFLKNDNTLWFLGESLNGQSTKIKDIIFEPVQIAENVQYAKMFGFTSAWIDSEYNLYLCGDNSYGQIGNGTTGCGFPTLRRDIVEEPYCAVKYCISFSVEQGYNGVWSVRAKTDYGTEYIWGGEYGAIPIYAD